jgi:hypothetical protein
MKLPFLLLFFLLASFHCSTPQENPVSEKKRSLILGAREGQATQTFYPAGEKEKILNEKGEEVQITDLDPEPFRLPSKDPGEMFRVIISGDGYQLRQIRGASLMRRKPDPGGDQLMIEDVSKYDLIDKVDDGLMVTKLNSKTGKLENVNFYKRMPRIHDLAKIMQNDSTRWVLEHKPDQDPAITKFYTTYYIVLQNKKSRDEVKGILKKEKR